MTARGSTYAIKYADRILLLPSLFSSQFQIAAFTSRYDCACMKMIQILPGRSEPMCIRGISIFINGETASHVAHSALGTRFPSRCGLEKELRALLFLIVAEHPLMAHPIRHYNGVRIGPVWTSKSNLFGLPLSTPILLI